MAKKADTGKSSDQIQITITAPLTGYRKSIHADRVSVSAFAHGDYLITFGCTHQGTTIDTAAIILSYQVVLEARKMHLDYLGKIDSLASDLPEWNAPTTTPIGTANFMRASFHGDRAETIFTDFSHTALNELVQKGTRTIDPEPVLLVRSTVDLQKALITGIFGED